MPKSTVFAVRPDRLGGRLSAIVNAKRLADMFDLDLKIFWSKPKNAYPELVHPEAVFSQDFIDAHFLPSDTVKAQLKFTPMAKPAAMQPRPKFVSRAAPDGRSKFKPLVRRTKLGSKQGFEARIKLGENFGFTTREGAVALPFEDEASARAGFANTFSNLDFSDAFRATMTRIDDRLADGKTYVGVHIRRGDVIRNQNTSEGFWHGQYVPDLVYFTALDELKKVNTRLIFFCDDDAVLKTFLTRYPDAVCAADFCAVGDQPALHVDLAEMYLLSRCARILCPRSSAFSLVATDLSGGIHEPVEDLLNPEQMAVTIARLVDQLRHGVAAFHSVGDYKQALNALASYHQRGVTDLSPVTIAGIAHDHGVATVTILEMALAEVLNSDDAAPLAWLADMVQNYPVPHISALGECFALLACGEDAIGDQTHAQQHLIWANWLYPESQTVGAITSVLACDDAPFSRAAYGDERAKLFLPIHRGLQFLTKGDRDAQFDKSKRHGHYTAGFILMDWLEFVNPNTRRKLLMRSPLHRKLDADLSESIAALDQVMAMRSKRDFAQLEALHLAAQHDPYIAKRLATACLRMGDVPRGLDLMKVASDQAVDDPAFKAAYAIRLVEFGQESMAVDVFDALGDLAGHWLGEHPAVITAHAQARLAMRDYAKGMELIQRNLAFSRSCKVSLTVHNRLSRFT